MATSPYIAASRAAFLALGLGAFIHFNMSTATGTENESGNGPVTGRRAVGTFTPYSNLADAQTKIGAALDAYVAAGFRYIVPTTAHGGSYCLWPSAVNGYNCVAYDGQPNILKVICDTAATKGLRVGLYHALGDNVGSGESNAVYAARVVAELQELLSGTYGTNILCVWLDGANITQAGLVTVNGTVYGTLYAACRAAIEALQPACLVLINDHLYNSTNSDAPLIEEFANAKLYCCDHGDTTAIRGGEICDTVFVPQSVGAASWWFCNPADDHPLKTKAHIRMAYAVARAFGNNFLLNVPWGTSGGLTSRVAAYLASFGNLTTSTSDIALNGTASASSYFGNPSPTYAPAQMISGNYDKGTFFATDVAVDVPTVNTASATITLSSIAKAEGINLIWRDDGYGTYNRGVYFQLLDGNNTVIYTSTPYNDDGSQGGPEFYAFDFPTYSQAKKVVIKQKPGAGRAGGMGIIAANLWSGGAQSLLVDGIDRLAPRHYWTADRPSNASHILDRGSSPTGTMAVSNTSGITSVASPFSGGDTALLFNGSTHGYAAVDTPRTNNFAIVVSLMANTLPQDGRVFCVGQESGAGYGFVVGSGGFSSGSKLHAIVNTVGAIFDTATTLTTSGPVVAVLQRSNNTWQWYINGALIASDSAHAPSGVPSGEWTLGARDYSDAFYNEFFGTIDDAAYFDRVLSAAEVTFVANRANGVVLTAGVARLISFTSIQTIIAWTAGSNGTMTITGQLQVSVNAGGSWSDIAGPVEGVGLGTDNTTTSPLRIYRVKFSDGVSADVYSNVVSIPSSRGLHRWLSWLPAFP